MEERPIPPDRGPDAKRQIACAASFVMADPNHRAGDRVVSRDDRDVRGDLGPIHNRDNLPYHVHDVAVIDHL